MSRTVEEWRDIEGYNGKYQVSDWGRVRDTNYRNTETIKIRKLSVNNWGYNCLKITQNGKTSFYFIHRLVYETFMGEIPNEMQVNHIDETKTNNCLWNLNLMKPKDNSNYGTRNSRISETKKSKKYNIIRKRDNLGRFAKNK